MQFLFAFSKFLFILLLAQKKGQKKGAAFINTPRMQRGQRTTTLTTG
jgi:hypothetical protein